ncbi:esterase family protein [Sporosarcina sp. BI001-red]|uniref:alpha/beta hydrolase n=1 Tax=Sporosarcina sp. BI001-red TaxID=2282866 RepID=UPI000E227C1D|nr:alpha/beta hydrolase-fold protein [Sporosarcina sp. BI001-red]REB09574.1 esterase family protein [Sporosarcina sp. BI001-red]
MNYGKIHDILFYSEALQEEMELLIHLPHNYSPLYKYSVLFASDGKDYFQYGRIGKVIDEYLDKEEIENVIVIGIPYKTVSERRRMYHPDGDRQKDYIRFLVHELVPYIDEHYPTYQIGGGRGLIGDSLAATVSLQTALHYPNCFGQVILHSPYVDEKVLEAVHSAKNPSGLSVYHVIGTEETEVVTTVDGKQDFLTPNRELNKLFENKGFPYFYEEFNGEHTWKYWQPDVRRAIQMVYGQ